MTEKRDKGSVQYGVGMRERHCSNCEHWIPGGSCEIVEGTIRSDYWCNQWRRRARDERSAVRTKRGS